MVSKHTRAELEARIWDEIEKGRIGMLGLVGDKIVHKCQPMTAFAEPNEQTIWFFSRDDTSLAWRAGLGACDAQFIVQGKNRQLWACLCGKLSVHADTDRKNKYWNQVISAWYADGKRDPHVILMRLDVNDVDVWLLESGPAVITWEILKANLTKKSPNLGEHAYIDMRH